MFTPRTATGLTIALLALPATATAQTSEASAGAALSTHYSWGQTPAQPAPVQPNPDQRTIAPTSSLAGTTTPQDHRNPDGADAARAGDIAKAMEHYQRSQPLPAAARPASPPQGGYQLAASHHETPVWPEIAVTGVILLATAGGVVRVRTRRRRSARVAA